MFHFFDFRKFQSVSFGEFNDPNVEKGQFFATYDRKRKIRPTFRRKSKYYFASTFGNDRILSWDFAGNIKQNQK